MLPRSSNSFLAAACAGLLLIACQKETGLPSDEVLRRAAHAAQELASARFSAEASFKSKDLSGSIQAEGRLQDAGGQWDFNVTMRLGSGNATAWDASADVVVGEGEAYIRMQDVRVDQQATFPLPFPLLRGKWVRLTPSSTQPPVAVTPDPRFLEMQAEVVHVLRDRGIERIGDERVYHYDTAIDPVKFKAFLEEVSRTRGEAFDAVEADRILTSTQLLGQLWIGAEDFQVLRVEWAAQAQDESGYTGTLSLRLKDHNAAPPVVPPEGAVPLEQFLFGDGASSLPTLLEGDTMTSQQEEDLRELLYQ